MDIEALKELLGEYFLPVGSFNWSQFLLNALPSVVTVFTVITTTVIQLKNSKRETERFMAQLEQQKELERIRCEEARKNATHEFQLKAEENLRSERMTAYSDLIDTLYNSGMTTDSARLVPVAYKKSIKLLSLCTPSDELFASVQFLVELFESLIYSKRGITDLDVQSLKASAQDIAHHLNRSYHADSSKGAKPEPEQR